MEPLFFKAENVSLRVYTGEFLVYFNGAAFFQSGKCLAVATTAGIF